MNEPWASVVDDGHRRVLRTQRVLWFALQTSILLYCGALFVIKAEHAGPLDPMLVPAFAFVSLGVIAASFVMPARAMKQGLSGVELPVRQVSYGASDVLPMGALPATLAFADPRAALQHAMAIGNTALILKLALREAVGLFGFMLKFLGFGWPVAAPFLAVSWLLILAGFPSIKTSVDLLERARGARLLPLDG